MENLINSILPTIGKFLVVALAIVAPIKSTMIALGFLMFADLILGILAARKEVNQLLVLGYGVR